MAAHQDLITNLPLDETVSIIAPKYQMLPAYNWLRKGCDHSFKTTIGRQADQHPWRYIPINSLKEICLAEPTLRKFYALTCYYPKTPVIH